MAQPSGSVTITLLTAEINAGLRTETVWTFNGPVTAAAFTPGWFTANTGEAGVVVAQSGSNALVVTMDGVLDPSPLGMTLTNSPAGVTSPATVLSTDF